MSCNLSETRFGLSEELEVFEFGTVHKSIHEQVVVEARGIVAVELEGLLARVHFKLC
jgi:hypothetical protein